MRLCDKDCWSVYQNEKLLPWRLYTSTVISFLRFKEKLATETLSKAVSIIVHFYVKLYSIADVSIPHVNNAVLTGYKKYFVAPVKKESTWWALTQYCALFSLTLYLLKTKLPCTPIMSILSQEFRLSQSDKSTDNIPHSARFYKCCGMDQQ